VVPPPFQLIYGTKQHPVAIEERHYGPRWLSDHDNDEMVIKSTVISSRSVQHYYQNADYSNLHTNNIIDEAALGDSHQLFNSNEALKDQTVENWHL